MNASQRVRLFLCAAFTLLFASHANAQCVSLTTLGSASTQNFDTLSNVAGSTTNNLTITGWFMTESGGGARDNEQYAVDTGGSTSGDTYSYGAAAATERALGSLRSGTLIPIFGACFTNNTGATITSLPVAYSGEEWRLGTAARTDQLSFEYSTNATDLVTGAWTGVPALNFVTPDTATTGAKNGNAAADRSALSSTISSLSIADGATFWIRWTDVDATGADDGLAVDDFSITPQGGVALNLTINDVSLNEGNAGTTSFTFTVSLSAPAPPGGVTFDIATADGTAVAPGDYTAKSLTAQTIPAGSSTYSFTVLVNGDTTPETNETFLVNVTNVTGATVTDGQGQGTIVNDDAAPNLTVNDVSLNEGNAGTTTYTFTVSLSAPAPAGGVTFDIGTANGTAVAPGDYTAKSLTGQTIPAGSSTYTFDVLVNGDTTPESDETFLVNITNVTNAIVTDGQGLGTIVNDDVTLIHDVQGNGAATPIPGSTVTVQGVVIGQYQGASKLGGFFLQEEDVDVDADPSTSEGIFIFCNSCPTPVAEGQQVKVTGTVSEFNNMTEITATTAGSVVVVSAGNHLAEVTPSAVSLPIAGDLNAYYEAREGMLVTFSDTLSVADFSQLASLGQLSLSQGGRPVAFTETSAPNAANYAAYLDTVARREVILDDANDAQYSYLAQPDGSQAVFHPIANGGFSVGTQGTDFFRGGDLVNGLTGVLQFSSPGSGAATWRIRPTAAHPVVFTVANPRPATAPAVGGAIKAATVDLSNYFTTIDTTASNTTGPCGPSGGQDCRGADSVAELNRQRERVSIVLCNINAEVFGLTELENTTPSSSITDLLGAVNARCGGAHPYAFVNTGGTLGTDVVRVQSIYRTGIVSPVGSPLVDLDPTHTHPPTAQTFDVVDAANAAFGQRFTAIVAQFASRTCDASSIGSDADAGDGQGCYAARRASEASRLLTWINGTVIPAAGDPDVLLFGNFNSLAQEPPVTTITGGGYTDLQTAFLGTAAYSDSVNGELGHLQYVFASTSLTPQVTTAAELHINADESDLFDYNDEVADSGEAATEEKPDGSALVPPRVVFQPASMYRQSSHDPVIAGLFEVADLAITKVDTPDPVSAGTNLTYTISVSNNGPDAAASASWSDTLPAGTTFVSLPAVSGWSCTTPAVGAGGTVSCSNPSFSVGNSVFTLTVAVGPAVPAGTVLSNTATTASSTPDGNPGNESATAVTTVVASADLSITKVDTPDPVTAGANLTYTITVTNAGPSNAASASLSDTLPAGTTFVALSAPAGWSCTTPAVGGTGTISCSIGTLATGNAVFTLTANVGAGVANGTVLSNNATVTSSTSDPNAGNESATATTTVAGSADLSVSNVDSPDPVSAGANLTYTITVTNAGPSNAASASLSDTLPAGTTFVALSAPAGWSCATPAVGGTGTISCTIGTLATGNAVFTLTANVGAGVAGGTVVSNNATVASSTSDPNPGNESATATTTVAASADLSVSNIDSPDPVTAGTNLTYTLTVANAGPSNAASASLTDTLPAGTTFVSLSAPGGWSCTTPAVGGTGTISCSIGTLATGNAVFTLTVNVDAGVASGTVIPNSATVASSTSDPNAGNDSATATTTVAASADLSVSNVDSPDPVTAGTNLVYTITVANAGPSNAASASLSDTLPAGTTFVSLSAPAGWSCTTPAVGGSGTISCSIGTLATGNAVFTLTVNVGAGVSTGTVLSNTATVSSATADPNSGNDSATATTTVATGSADLSVTKVDTPDPVNAGNNLSYTITVNNAGPSAATTVSLSDTLPAGTTFVSLSSPAGWSCSTPAVGATGTVSCSQPSMAVGNAVFTLVVQVTPSTTAGTVLTNTAAASSATTDPATGNESATATTTVGAAADLSVTKLDTPDPVTAGTNLTYTITVNNAGPSNAVTVNLTDTLPAGTTFVSLSSPAGWSCTTPAIGATGTVSCSAATLAAGNGAFTLVVAVAPGVVPGTVITNTASVTSTTTDTNPGNNSGTATTSVGAGSADVSLTNVDSPDPVSPGSTLSYTITATNIGPANASSPALTDTLPAGTTFVSLASPAGWICTTPAVGAAGTVSCTAGTLTVGANAVFTLNVLVAPSTLSGTVISNTASLTSSTPDPTPADATATASTTVAGGAALSGTKSVTGTFIAGGAITYTIVLTNSGDGTQGDNPGHEFTDVLPASLQLVSASATSGTAVTTTGTRTVTWDGTLAPGASVTITIQAIIDPAVTAGTTVNNQGTISYDADGNGTNESTGVTTDPAHSASVTTFTIPLAAPTLGEAALLLLAALLAVSACLVIRATNA
jgi:uncharacterized repeat protein (TIGR01451 family)